MVNEQTQLLQMEESAARKAFEGADAEASR
jgi:hypothetical protein